MRGDEVTRLSCSAASIIRDYRILPAKEATHGVKGRVV